MQVKFQLINANLLSGIGRLRSYSQDELNYSEFNVRLSSLLLYAIRNKTDDRLLKRGDHYLFTIFTSDTKSTQFSDCPFKLIHFVPVEGSDIPENYKLELINEPQSTKRDTPIFNVVTQKMEFYDNVFHKADTYLRYVQRKVGAMLSESKEGNQIVAPMMVNK